MIPISTRNDIPADQRNAKRATVFMGVMLAAALCLGGGGVAYGLNNLAVQIACLLLLGFFRTEFLGFWHDAPIELRLACAFTLALPLIQLAPLPPAVWQSLPGCELVTEALGAAQLPIGWRPASLDPARTLVAALGLIVPLAILAIGWRMPRHELIRLGWLAVLLGLLHFIWGIPQVLSQGQTAILYPENPMPGVMFGGFANRNSAGLLFVICLSLALHLPLPERIRSWGWLVRSTAIILFASAIILTQSRTAMVLTLVPLSLAAVRFVASSLKSRLVLLVLAAIAAIALAAAAIGISSGSRIETALDRFDSGDGGRAELWEDAGFSASRYWPVGSGMGTFDEVFQLDESLEQLSLRRAGRAHNDYLEWAIEGGLPALLIVALWIALVGSMAVQARRSPDRWIAWSGAVSLLAISLQAATDYPLRSQAMLAISALALLLLARFAGSIPESSK